MRMFRRHAAGKEYNGCADTNANSRAVAGNEPRGNPTLEKPYCWQSKAALRSIRACYGDDRRLPYLMATYLALTEIASDEGWPSFTKSVAAILNCAGGSYRKLTESLRILSGLGLLRIEHNFINEGARRGKAPSTYTLLSVRHGVPNPPAQYAQPLGTGETQSVPIEEKNANAKNLKNPQTPFQNRELRIPDERIGAIFHRKPTTRWMPKEIQALKAIGPIFEDDLTLLGRYYEAERRKGDKGIHRRDLGTFLNHFQGELDRATAWAEKHPLPPVRKVKVSAQTPADNRTEEQIAASSALRKEQLDALRTQIHPGRKGRTASATD